MSDTKSNLDKLAEALEAVGAITVGVLDTRYDGIRTTHTADIQTPPGFQEKVDAAVEASKAIKVAKANGDVTPEDWEAIKALIEKYARPKGDR